MAIIGRRSRGSRYSGGRGQQRTLVAAAAGSLPTERREGVASRLAASPTEADLVRQLATEPAGRPRGWFRALLTQRAADTAKGFARLHGQRARDVMTTELVAVEEDTPSEQIAQLMEERGVKRVPVLRDGKLVGVVSRADLLGLAFGTAAPPDVAVSDARLLRDVERAMREQPWADAYLVFPSVEDGVVTFHGWCRSPDVPRALRVLAESLPGVKDVQMDLREPPGFLLGVP